MTTPSPPTPVVYPRELAQRIVDEVANIYEHAGLSPALTAEQMARLLDAAWAATLLEEEGRRTRFTLAIAAPENATTSDARSQRFEGPRLFTASAIAKLAPASDVRETLIAVSPKGGDFEIWGLIHAGDRRFSIDLEIGPPFLTITGHRPGVLSVATLGHRLVLYASGVAHWYERRSQALTDLLRDTLHPYALELTPKSSGGTLAHEFERLAERLVLAGHGGALLISDPFDPIGVDIPTTSKFVPPDATLFDAALTHNRLETGGATEEEQKNFVRNRLDAERKHRDALNHVARLANVDGAVVMSPDLRVYGLGATIEMRPGVKMPEMRLIDPKAPTRHPQGQSSVCFRRAPQAPQVNEPRSSRPDRKQYFECANRWPHSPRRARRSRSCRAREAPDRSARRESPDPPRNP